MSNWKEGFLLVVLFCEFVRELTSGPRTLNFHFIVSNILIAKERKTHKNEKNQLGTLGVWFIILHINRHVSFLINS